MLNPKHQVFISNLQQYVESYPEAVAPMIEAVRLGLCNALECANKKADDMESMLVCALHQKLNDCDQRFILSKLISYQNKSTVNWLPFIQTLQRQIQEREREREEDHC